MVACPTLEVGSMLSIVFAACLSLGVPVLEKDLLKAAKDNSIQYLTAYRYYKDLPNY